MKTIAKDYNQWMFEHRLVNDSVKFESVEVADCWIVNWQLSKMLTIVLDLIDMSHFGIWWKFASAEFDESVLLLNLLEVL